MPRISIHCGHDDGPPVIYVGHTRYGHYIVLSVGDVNISVAGDDADAAVNARQWAKALTEAADQIVERLELETIATELPA